MARLHRTPTSDDILAELQGRMAGPGNLALDEFRSKLGNLLASVIDRIRLYRSMAGRRTKLLECEVDADTADARSRAAALTAIIEAVNDAAGEHALARAARDADVALDLTVDPADGSLSIDFVTERVLEGQNLAALAMAVAPDPAPPAQDFDLPMDDAYLTAAGAARLLGVAKSTVTRRIGNDELIGFRVFKNAFRIPREQFRDGDVVDGVEEILALFAIEIEDRGTVIDHKGAWAFLDSTLYPGDEAPRPIDRLRAASPRRSAGAVVAELALAKRSLDYGDHV